jgi:hypothetical protein
VSAAENPQELAPNGRDAVSGRFAAGWKGGGRKPGSLDLRRLVRDRALIEGYDLEGELFEATKCMIALVQDPCAKATARTQAFRALVAAFGETAVSVTHRESMDELFGPAVTGLRVLPPIPSTTP